MRIKVLGCSGGVGGNSRTTSFLVDQDILIDAGTGVGEMSLAEMSQIDHVFLTHSHLDHIAMLPLLVDSVGFLRLRPITIYATEETLNILEQHIFNWKVWPDFSKIPDAEQPYVRYCAVRDGETVELNGRRFTPIAVNHVVPAVGYCVDSGEASWVFSGDTTTNDSLWAVVNETGNLRYLVVETAFPNAGKELAMRSKHYCPSLLADDLAKLKRTAELYITHMKPGEIDLTMRELREDVAAYAPQMLQNGQVFEF
ncbi:MAG: 3',5'-cyclic-nucleotide phosphodiesterase [Pseudomonadota bacterium]